MFLQRGVAPEHTVPQPPQLAGAERSASQPFAAFPSQLAYAAEQATPQLLPLQVAVPLAGVGHGEHAVPQVARLVLLTHVPPQAW